MTGFAWIAFALTAAFAVADWVAVAASVRKLELIAKPAVMVGLIAAALLLDPANFIQRGFFVVALGFGLASDIFLMLPQDLFLMGLATALVEHLAYIGGFRARDFHLDLLGWTGVIVLVSLVVVLPPVYRALKQDHPSLVWPVVAYVAVFVVMVFSAGGTGSLIALSGAVLFFWSDGILAWNRFVKPLPGGRLANIVLYHAGQALLVLSLAS
ncbi:MAG TPA: lysoplasmalogenase [Candidatus Dormibacteraeota bacterium]|nr:lysoplasmalogenase [Candidatus Dormibacteraeota bacterium]